MTKQQRQRNLFGILIGLAATLIVLAAYMHGALDRLELITLDLRYRHANSITASDRIVCLDITDRDLEMLGRWPWPRDLQAPLIAIPAEFGAEAILVDLTWTEPETARSIAPEHADILSRLDDLASGEQPERVFPDLNLRAAIAGAENVYLAYHHSMVDLERSGAFRELVQLLLDGKTVEAAELASRIDHRLRIRIKNDDDYRLQRPLDRAVIITALIRNPTLEETQLAKLVQIDDGQFLERAFERCRDTVLRWKLTEWLDQQPERWQGNPDELIGEFFELTTKQAFTGKSPLKHAVIRAYREVLSYAATTRAPLVDLELIEPITRSIDGITPVHFEHARVARRCCYANFEPDLDGTVRRVALAEQHDGNVLGQLAFAAGWDLLDINPESISAAPKKLIIQSNDSTKPPLEIQLDGRGRTLIPWVRGREWSKQFTHRPASSVLRLHDLRQNLLINRREATAFLNLLFSSEFLPEFNELADLLAERTEVERQSSWQRLRRDTEMADFFQEQLDKIDREALRGERQLRAFIEQQRLATADEKNTESVLPPQLIADVDYFLTEIERIHAASRIIVEEIAEIEQRLTAIFDGKICVLGYAATSLADMVPIPTQPRAPGVIAHANLLNGLLTGQVVYWATPPTNITIAVVFGIITTLIATFLRPRTSLLLVVFLIGSFVAIGGALAFYRWSYWIALTPPVAVALSAYILIAIYRYIFIEGERRQLATALGQYTSKEMARQMAENPELCRRAEMREVTAVFTDLKGFTSISERIGAQRTQEVLNICLGRFTEVMLRHEGMVNKFIGDGVFAFWNPVIYPQEDHARRACITAVDLLTGLEALRIEQRQSEGDDVFEEIVLRIGIATGKAVVGPCGSEQKYDYTCIGDSVNVAARLESGNKFYGTQILVNDATRKQVGDEFEFRPLGGVRVKGKNVAVPVYELLGVTGRVDNKLLAYAGDFGRAITLFQQRKWDESLEALEACRKSRGDDLAVENYIAAIRALRQNPPGEDWTGAIELTEK